MGDLTAHFSRKERSCRCCGRLTDRFTTLGRTGSAAPAGGQRILLHAGYRCARHNREVGGAPHSEHLEGLAADVSVPGLSLQKMYELALEVPQFAEGGIGVYDGNLCTWMFGTAAPAGPGSLAATLELLIL